MTNPLLVDHQEKTPMKKIGVLHIQSIPNGLRWGHVWLLMLLKFDFSNFIGYGQKNVADMFFIWFLLS
jgi:hypothetical protein